MSPGHTIDTRHIVFLASLLRLQSLLVPCPLIQLILRLLLKDSEKKTRRIRRKDRTDKRGGKRQKAEEIERRRYEERVPLALHAFMMQQTRH